jgi:hypothetical protein
MITVESNQLFNVLRMLRTMLVVVMNGKLIRRVQVISTATYQKQHRSTMFSAYTVIHSNMVFHFVTPALQDPPSRSRTEIINRGKRSLYCDSQTIYTVI